MAQYSGVKSALGSSDKEWRTIHGNRFAVFAASLQCTEKVSNAVNGRGRVAAEKKTLLVSSCPSKRKLWMLPGSTCPLADNKNGGMELTAFPANSLYCPMD